MSLRRKTTHAIGWQLAARMTDRGLRFCASVFLARMLAPDDFGALAATLVISSAVETITYVGIDQAIAQSPRSADPRFLGSAFRISAFRGALLALLIYVSAPLVAWYFESEALLSLTRVIALSPLFVGLGNPWVHSERKELRFRAFSLAMVIGGIGQITTSILCARAGFGAISLAYGIVVNSAVTTAAGWLLVARRLDLRKDPTATLEFRVFARRAAGVPALIMLHLQAPALVLGRLAGLPVLGIYTLADRLCSLPSEIALPVFGTVLAPAYAQVRDDQVRLRSVWLRVLGGVPLIAIAPITAMVALDERVPTLVYGERYGSTPGLISALALVALLSTLTSCCGPLFWGIGRPDLDRMAVLLRVCVLAVTATLGALWFVAIGFALGVSVAYIAALMYCLPMARRMTNASWREIVRALAPAGFVGGVTLALDVLLTRAPWMSEVTSMWMCVLVGCVTMVTMMLCGLRLKRVANG